MRIKVCGMRDPENIAAIGALRPDYLGFIFYEGSPRHAGGLDPAALEALPADVRRVGVFVDARGEFIRESAERYRLDLLQLHGDEPPEVCRRLRAIAPTIKAFGVAEAADVARAAGWEGACDYFLFDAKTPGRGGAGTKFDHRLLTAYLGATPYFLSGGIGPDDAAALSGFDDPRCVALDINSRFETVPAVKDPALVKTFIKTLKNQ